jgi:hypothetical protein
MCRPAIGLPLPPSLLALFAAAPGALGCMSVFPAGAHDYCAPPSDVADLAPDPAPPLDAPREAHVAALLGARDLWEGAARDEMARIRLLDRREAARLEIDATAAELDCETQRALQAADYLERAKLSAVQRFTLGSIGAAAATTVLGVLLSTREAPDATQDAAAIGGGAVTAGLAVASLYVHPHVVFAHPRNLLADVWSGSGGSTLYPAFVWGYLNRDAFSNDQKAPIRVKITDRWRRFEGVGDAPATAALLFGAGGEYDDEELRMRAAMLADVRVEVELANQDLAALKPRGSR